MKPGLQLITLNPQFGQPTLQSGQPDLYVKRGFPDLYPVIDNELEYASKILA